MSDKIYDNKRLREQYKAMDASIRRAEWCIEMWKDADTTKCGQIELPSQLYKEIWNRAMDKAIEACNKYESYGAAYEIRTLKV